MIAVHRIIAIGLVAISFAPASAQADDTTRLLAGAGSLNPSPSAKAIVLKMAPSADAQTLPVCYWRRWGYAYCPPVCPPIEYAAPSYYHAPTYYAPPAAMMPAPVAGPAAYYYPPSRQPVEAVAVAPRPF